MGQGKKGMTMPRQKNPKKANKGMALENMVEYTNKVYYNKGRALVNKIPTPFMVRRNSRGQVVGGYPQKKSTVDFVGIARSIPIAFDAKGTKETTRFPLKNIEKHQLDYLRDFRDHGGVAFFLIYFEKLGEAYYIPIATAFMHWMQQYNGGRKSLSYDWISDKMDPIISQNGVPLDYLAVI